MIRDNHQIGLPTPSEKEWLGNPNMIPQRLGTHFYHLQITHNTPPPFEIQHHLSLPSSHHPGYFKNPSSAIPFRKSSRRSKVAGHKLFIWGRCLEGGKGKETDKSYFRHLIKKAKEGMVFAFSHTGLGGGQWEKQTGRDICGGDR